MPCSTGHLNLPLHSHHSSTAAHQMKFPQRRVDPRGGTTHVTHEIRNRAPINRPARSILGLDGSRSLRTVLTVGARRLREAPALRGSSRRKDSLRRCSLRHSATGGEWSEGVTWRDGRPPVKIKVLLPPLRLLLRHPHLQTQHLLSSRRRRLAAWPKQEPRDVNQPISDKSPRCPLLRSSSLLDLAPLSMAPSQLLLQLQIYLPLPSQQPETQTTDHSSQSPVRSSTAWRRLLLYRSTAQVSMLLNSRIPTSHSLDGPIKNLT